MRKRAVTGLLLLLTTTAARAQEALWAGTWRDEATGQSRTISVDGGEASTTVKLGDTAVTCRGRSRGASLALEGELPHTLGLAGVLEARELEGGERTVRVDVQLEPEGEDGAESATARVRFGRRLLRQERWSRPGVARLELLRTDGAGGDGLDPIEGGLAVHVRVLGRPQDVTLAVELPWDEQGSRASFYRQAGARGGVIHVLRAGVLEPGEHELEWDGRDDTWAERIALQGSYVLRVDSPERRADAERPKGQVEGPKETITVARPKAVVHNAEFTVLRSAPETLDGLVSELTTEFRVTRTSAAEKGLDFLARMGAAAATYVDTHGDRSVFLTGDGHGVTPDKVLQALAADPDRKPLRDVHAVFLAGCNIGLPTVLQGPDGEPAGRLDLCALLLVAGVDVVVTFRASVVASDVAAYHGLLGPKLLEYGAPIRRATHDAARQAAEDGWYWWNELLAAANAGWDFFGAMERLMSVEDALVVRAGPGIDPGTETLMPARHGVSTN